MLGIGRRLATDLQRSVVACKVLVRDEIVELLHEDGEGFSVSISLKRIDADGAVADLPHRFDDVGEQRGDMWETCSSLLFESMEDAGIFVCGLAERYTFELSAEMAQLPARVRSIVALASEATDVSLIEVAGQRAIRLEFPDGNQMSVVTDEELELARKLLPQSL